MTYSIPLRSTTIRRLVSAMLRATVVGWSFTACTDVPSAPSVDGPAGDPNAAPFSGQAAILIDGLPPGRAADLLITGPRGFRRFLTASDTLRGLAAGRYTVQYDAAGTADGALPPNEPTQSFEIVDGGPMVTLRTGARAPLRRSIVSVAVSGLPTGTPAAVQLINPAGGVTALTESGSIETSMTGDWTVSAASVQAGGHTYIPTPTVATRTVRTSDAVTFAVSHTVSTGALAVAVTGLPTGQLPSVAISGPAGFQRTVTSTTTFTNLQPGAYSIVASPVTVNGISYAVTPSSRTVTVDTGLVAAAATLNYAATTAPTGSLQVTVSGLPSGAAASVLLSGPNSFSRVLTAGGTVSDLVPGSYTLQPQRVRTTAGWYDGGTQATVTVQSGATATGTATYAPRPAALQVSLNGVPTGATATVTLTSPSGVTTPVTSTTWMTAQTGRWLASTAPVKSGGFTWFATPAAYDETVLAGDTLRFPVTYTLGTGAIAVSVAGLPQGTNGSVTITGPNSFNQALTGTQTLTDLLPGSYTITAAPVTSGGITYSPSPASRTVTVTASLVAQAAAVSYASQAGQLTLTLNGLPTGSAGDVLLTGPNGYAQTVTATSTLTGLGVGSYTITPRTVRTASGSFSGGASPSSVSVTAGGSANSTVTYSAMPSVVLVTTSGLPGGTNAALTLTSPSNANTALTGNHTVSPAASGRWRLAASSVPSGGHTYTPTPASYDQTVLAGDTLRFPVAYSLSTGAIAITVSGLPTGTTGNVTVTGPNSFTRSVTGTTTLTNLTPGNYTISTAAVTASGTTYQPSPATRVVAVTASLVAQAAPVAYSAQVGQLTVSVSGLPTGDTGDVQVTGPNGFTQTLTATTTLSSLGVGSYTITPRPVRTASGSFSGVASPASVSITAGGTANSTVTYSALPSVVLVTTTGLPGGTNAALTLTSPSNANTALTGNHTVSPAASGRWRLAASNVPSGGHTYAPSPASYDLTVLAGDTLRFPVAYSLSTGAIAITVSGLPTGTTGSVTVTGPNSFSQNVTGTTTLTNLVPGNYTISAASVSASGTTYAPTPASRVVAVTASLVAQAAPVAYSAQAGQLTVTLNGLPTGGAGDVQVTGPNGFAQTLTATTTLSSLGVGTYTLTPRTVRTASGSYAGVASPTSVSVTAGGSASSTVTYSALPSVVLVTSTGLPGGTNAALTLTSPSSVNTALTGAFTVSPAASGRWRLAASNVPSGGHTYTPSPASYDLTVLAGDTLRFPVTYSLSTGAIGVTVSGLPSGTNGSVTVTGPNSFSQSVTATTTLTNLVPGSYTVAATAVTRNGIGFTPSPASRAVTVTASLVAQSAPVAYTGQFGRLTTSASGLPGGATPTFSLTGTATRSITGAVTTDSLPSGAYTVTANSVTVSGVTYTPTPSSSAVTISTGATATASFSYTAPGGGGGGGSTPNVLIENAYVTQATQNWAGTAQVVAGRDALLRVFVRAAATNTARPDVRARIYENGTEIASYTIAAPGTAVPTAITEGTLTSSWNVRIPASNVRAGMRVLVEVDPNNTLQESDRSDNVWPRGGTPQTVNAITAPTLNVRFIPVTVQGVTGNVSDANREQYLTLTRQIFPLSDIASTVRAPFTSSAPALQSGNGNGAWFTVLNELNALRMTDGAPANLHYYGVVKVAYTSGVAGVGNQPGRAAVGWDHMSTASAITAHELGHNFSLAHAPCGTTGTPLYPYSGGVIGVWGWNATSNTLVAPTATDVMGYCSNQWVSDWTWSRVAQQRSTSGVVANAGPEEGLLVWGRGGSAGYVLEPAFPVRARPSAEPANATHEVEVYDDRGVLIANRQFAMETVDHAAAEQNEQFATVIPMEPALRDRASRVVVRSLRSPRALATLEPQLPTANLGGQPGQVTTTAPRVERLDARQRRASFDERTFRMGMVRDRDTGEILAFVRRSGSTFEAGNRRVELVLSDGVKSQRAFF